MNYSNHCRKLPFPLKKINLCLSGLLLAFPYHAAYAVQTEPSAPAAKAVLDTVTVTGDKTRARDVTGLGKEVKSKSDLDKAQVFDVRDLIRYDSGISITESGRGGYSGFSIRGVDKNRVSVLVDGLAQAQSFGDTRSGFHSSISGAVNEIEFENLNRVELTKGADSVSAGSGALGGSVLFRTKKARDIIKPGKNWGLDVKNAYSGRNNQFLNSIGVAAQHGGFDVMAQYTHRQGHETEVHDDIAGETQYITPQTLRMGEIEYASRWNPSKKYMSGFLEYQPGKDNPSDYDLANRKPTVEPRQPGANVTEKDTVAVSAKKYTGPQRIVPNPIDYKSDSLLLRLGYAFNDKHHVGVLSETTKQGYDIQDMTKKSYNDLKGEWQEYYHLGSGSPYYPGKEISWGFPNIRYARGHFYDDRIKRRRLGAEYTYTGGDESWLDKAELRFDKQKITIDSDYLQSRCGRYPDIQKHCVFDEYGKETVREHAKQEETRKQVSLDLNKYVEWGKVGHQIDVSANLGDNSITGAGVSARYTTKSPSPSHEEKVRNIPLNSGRTTEAYAFDVKPAETVKEDLKRGTQAVDLKHKYWSVGLSDKMKINDKLDLGFGIRYDANKVSDPNPLVNTGSFNHLSWSAGASYRPFAPLTFDYKYSTGFRMPSYRELYGIRDPRGNDIFNIKSHVKKETAANHELGLTFKHDYGKGKLTYFRTDYKDFISEGRRSVTDEDRALIKQLTGQNLVHAISDLPAYANLSSLKIHGFDINTHWDLNRIWNRLPDGLELNLGYSQVKKRGDVKMSKDVDGLRSYNLDALQPPRYTAGLAYNASDKKWGVAAKLVHSKAKNPDELVEYRIVNGEKVKHTANANPTGSWTTLDLDGYVKIGKKATLRAGIYNVFDRKYIPWENLRQTSSGGAAQLHNFSRAKGDIRKYTAPGRNFNVAFEMKF